MTNWDRKSVLSVQREARADDGLFVYFKPALIFSNISSLPSTKVSWGRLLSSQDSAAVLLSMFSSSVACLPGSRMVCSLQLCCPFEEAQSHES